MWTTTKRCLLRCIATLCVATVFLVRAEDADAPFATQLAKLIADDGAANDIFGHSVAISDGIAVVGAFGDKDKGSYSGSAYVFEMSDSSDATSWTQVAKLTADDGAAYDNFGASVVISDGTIVVGAYNDDDKGSNSGSAYVFEKSDSSDATSWTQVVKLTAKDGAANDKFGFSVAISDGTIVVGAYGDDDKGSASGSAYVFEKSDSSDATSWTQAAKLTADDGAVDDYFGRSVAISDGTIVVGANADDDKGSYSGSAYVFEMSDSSDATSWTQAAKLTADDGAASDSFGNSVAISDGTIVVGAYNDDDKGSNSGSAYVFEKSDSSDATSWTQVVKLTAKDGAANDKFGFSVAISDGTIVVGAYGDDDKGSASGSAYVFEKSDSSDATSWTQAAKLTADDGAVDDYFGRSVAISDGTIVVGAYFDDDKAYNSGSAYIFGVKTEPSPPPPPPSPPPSPLPPPPSPPPSPPPYEEYPIKLLKTIYANGTITEEVVESSAAARLGAALMPSSSSDAFVAAVACVALLAVVATRRARKTSFVNGEEADGLLNANTYGAIYNA